MVGSILDAVFAQAKAAVTRAYVAAGLLPALILVSGWQLHKTRSFGGIRTAIEPLLNKPTSDYSTSVLLYASVVIATGVGFYAARGLVLRTLRDVPGPVLQWLRDLLMARQVRIWTSRRRLNIPAEQHLTVMGYLRKGALAEKGPSGYCSEAQVSSVLRDIESSRSMFESLIRNDMNPDRHSAEQIFVGVAAFYSLPEEHRKTPGEVWAAVLREPPAKELVERLHAVAWRRALEARQEIQQQPLEEWWLAPTKLGNVVAALDDYAKRRYKISTSTLFTRLWGTLGSAERTEIATAQLTLESFANVTVAFGALAIALIVTSVRGIFELPPHSPMGVDWWTTSFVVFSIALCAVSYSATIYAFQSVAENIIRLIDLHRVRILTAFGFAPPQTFEEEQALFQELDAFFSSGTDKDLKLRKLDARTKPAAKTAISMISE